ncbi:hypothetical protein SEPCBS57363_001753 [Sporothrix epigloea]|uniref:Uncharacterized protein n=1 Tax=Sporothrix epigloea TaxID=1892477 RepID=A0ABP0DDN1_9PEZI
MSDQQSPDVKDTMAATRDSDSCTASVVYTIELIENDPFYCDDVMRDVLVEAFESWSVADLMSVRPGHLPKLRNLSMDRGVYIRNHTVPGGSLAQSIFDAFNAENPLDWPRGTLETYAKNRVIMTRNADLLPRLPLDRIFPEFLPLVRAPPQMSHAMVHPTHGFSVPPHATIDQPRHGSSAPPPDHAEHCVARNRGAVDRL